MHLIKKWIAATRLETTLLAVLSVGVGNALALFVGSFNWQVGVLATLTAMLLQVVCNLANDYGDFIHGTDPINPNKTPSALQTGLATFVQIKQAIFITLVAAMGTGLWLIYSANLSVLECGYFSLLGLTATAAAITYTVGENPYGYQGWGDIAVFIFFGIVGVGGTFYLQVQQPWDLTWVLPAVSYGSLNVAILNINNIRDYNADMQVGKRTLPVQYGLAWAIRYHWVLLLSSLVSALVFTTLYYSSWWQWIFVMGVPSLLRRGYVVANTAAPQLHRELALMALSMALFVVLFGAGLVMAAWQV